jgi:hypothetical protein
LARSSQPGLSGTEVLADVAGDRRLVGTTSCRAERIMPRSDDSSTVTRMPSAA